MKTKKLNVIDLDKTLVKYDTFRVLIIREIKKGNLRIAGLTMLRKARLLSLTNFKMKVQKVMAEKYPASFFEEYADEIFADTDPEIMQLIQDKSDENTVNILLSASPNDYVQFLCKKLNWEGSGSYFDETGKFQHLYGMTKKKWVQTVFPQNNYQYHFAVSDSKTDSEVMGLFEEKLFWNHLA